MPEPRSNRNVLSDDSSASSTLRASSHDTSAVLRHRGEKPTSNDIQSAGPTKPDGSAGRTPPLLSIQSHLLSSLPRTSSQIARLQGRIRTPVLDTYFLWTSALGTTGFFMIFLPGFFFFGLDEDGRQLTNVLAAGTYFSSLLKDLVQVPRPLVPPVTRLSLEYHHLEYGFPSSHSTSSTSLVLHFSYLLLRSNPLIPLSLHHLIIAHVVLFLFWASVVFGRIYCGMHSFMDCAAGCVLGAVLSWGVIVTGWRVDGWLDEGGWNVPITIFLLTTLLASLRPKPPVPCPCFGDAVSFVSVVSGISTGRYLTTTFQLTDLFQRPILAAGTAAGSDWIDTMRWLGWAGGKYLLGIVIIILYRLLAKLVLPQIYSLILLPIPASPPASTVDLPSQTPSPLPSSSPSLPKPSFTSSSSSSPSNISFSKPSPTDNPLLRRRRPSLLDPYHVVPSVVDLVGLELSAEEITKTKGETLVDWRDAEARERERRRVEMDDRPDEGERRENAAEGSGVEEKQWKGKKRSGGQGEGEVLRHGREVVTKVVVYFGIGILATHYIPLLFVYTGIGL